ncbi:MAG: cation diffusion facilitator family transporter [Desulfobacterales bacterium]
MSDQAHSVPCCSHADAHAHLHSHECRGHNHNHTASVADTGGSRLLITLLLNFVIPSAQIIGGLYAHSVALISDAVHNFSDFTAILIAYFAFRIGQKGVSLSHSFGYRRAEVLAALFNVMILTAVSLFIIREAAERFLHPQPVMGELVMWIAAIGVAGNGLSAWLLHKDAEHSLNVRGAFLHMMGDLFTSVAVLVSGLILMFRPWYWLDPLFSLLIVVFILKNCWTVLKEAVTVLMNATPVHIDLMDVQKKIEEVPEVCGAHYLHAWHAGTGIAFSAHVVVADQMLSGTEKLAQTIREKLSHVFGIDHAVLQFETADCGKGGVLCEMSCNGSPADQTETSGNRHHHGESAHRKEKMKKQFTAVLRIVLGLTFIYASLHKIMEPKAFAEAVYNYQILPDQLINLTAIALPVIEVLAGLCLVFNFWTPGAMSVINGMLIVFIAATAFNISRGLNIHCGCFESPGTEAADKWDMISTIVLDSVMLAAGVSVFLMQKNQGHREAHKAHRGTEPHAKG